jgi:hypothetical protein
MIPATVLLGSMAAGGLGLYLSGSTGSEPSTGIAKTVEDSVTSIADQVSKTTQDVTEYVSPEEEAPETPEETPEVTAPEPVAEPVAEPVPLPEEPQPVPQPVVEPVPEEENRAVAPTLPEIDSMAGGQRGGVGRPTWAPLNSRVSLAQALGVVPGTPVEKALATVTGTKTPESIQLKLKEIDDEIRVLKAQDYVMSGEVSSLETEIDGPAGIRREFSSTDSRLGLYTKLKNLYQSKIDKVKLEEEITKGSQVVFNLFTDKFPTDAATTYLNEANKLRLIGNTTGKRKKRGAPGAPAPGALTPDDKQWLIKAFRVFRSLTDAEKEDIDEENFFKVSGREMGSEAVDEFKAVDDATKPGFDLAANGPRNQGTMNAIYAALNKTEEVIANEWWNSTKGLNKLEEVNVEEKQAELEDLFNKKSAQETLILTEERTKKTKERQLIEKEKELTEKRTKLEEIKKKIKELTESKKLTLLDLSKFELPKTFMSSFSKQPVPVVKKSTLPVGDERNEIIVKIRDLDQRIKDKEEEISDYVSDNLQPDNTLSASATAEVKKMKTDDGVPGNLKDLNRQRDNEISKLEGRTGEKVQTIKQEIQESRKWKDMIQQLRLTPDKERKFLEPKLTALYASFETMIANVDESSIESNITSYYKTFTTQKDNWFLTSGLTTLIKSIVDLDDTLNKSGCPWTKGDKIRLFSSNSPAEIMGTGILPGDANRLYIEGTIIRPILTSSEDKSVEVCGQLRVTITKSEGFDANRALTGVVDNVNKEAKVSVAAGVEFLSGNLYDTWKRSVVTKIEAFDKLLERIKEDYPEPPKGIRGLNPVQSEKVVKRKQIQSLQDQLKNVALPFFSGQPFVSNPLRRLMNAPIESIKKVLRYLMKLKVKETLGNAAMTLLSPIPTLYNFIMRADWSDMKDIDRTIDMMTKLVEDITKNVDKFVVIPRRERENITQLLTDLKETKTTAKKEATLRALQNTFVAVTNAAGEEVKVWIPVATTPENERQVSIDDSQPNDPGDRSRREVTLYMKGGPLLDLNQYASMFDTLAGMLGMNYKLANGLLPLVRYRSVDKATYDGSANKVVAIKSPISGSTNFFDIYVISETILPESLGDRVEARKSNIGLVLYLIVKFGVTTIPAALLSIVPVGLWAGIKMIIDTRAVSHQAELAEAVTGLPNLMSELYFDLNNTALNTPIPATGGNKVPTVTDRVREEYTAPTDPYNLSEYNSTLDEIQKLIGKNDPASANIPGNATIDLGNADTELLLVQYKRLKQYQKALRALSDKTDTRSWYTAIISGLKTAGIVAGVTVGVPAVLGVAVLASPIYGLYLIFQQTPKYITDQINVYTKLASTLFDFRENFTNWDTIKETASNSFERRDASVTSSAKSLFGLNDPLTTNEKELIRPGTSLDTLEKFNAKFNELTSSVLGKIYQEATEGTGKQIATVSEYIDKFEEVFSTTNALQLMNTIKESVTKLYGTEVELNFFPVLTAYAKFAGADINISGKASGFQLVGLGLLYLIHMPVDIAVTSLSIGLGTGVGVAALSVAIAGAIPFKLIVTAIPILIKFFGDALTIVQTTLLIGKLIGGTIVYAGIVWPFSKLVLLFFSIGKVFRTIVMRPLLAIFSRATMGINILRGVSAEETTDWYASLKTFQLIDKEGKLAPKLPERVKYGQTTLKDWEAFSQFVSGWLKTNNKTFADFKVNYKEDAYAGLIAAIIAQDPKFIVKGDPIDTDEKVKNYLSKSLKRIGDLTQPLKKPILTAVPTDTTIALRWTPENDVGYTLKQDDVIDRGVVTTPHTINGLNADTAYSFKLTGTKGTQTIESDEINVRTLATPAGPTGPPPPPPPEEEEEEDADSPVPPPPEEEEEEEEGADSPVPPPIPPPPPPPRDAREVEFNRLLDEFLAVTQAQYNARDATAKDLFKQRGKDLRAVALVGAPGVFDAKPDIARRIMDHYTAVTGDPIPEPEAAPPPPPPPPPPPRPTAGPLQINFPPGRPKPAGFFSDPDKWLRTLQEDVNTFNRAYNNTNFYQRPVRGEPAQAVGPGTYDLAETKTTLRTRIDKIILNLNSNGLPSTTQMVEDDFSLDNLVKNRFDGKITAINLAFGQLFDDLTNKRKGGYTRRQRVRGMPKRLKTRRTY